METVHSAKCKKTLCKGHVGSHRETRGMKLYLLSSPSLSLHKYIKNFLHFIYKFLKRVSNSLLSVLVFFFWCGGFLVVVLLLFWCFCCYCLFGFLKINCLIFVCSGMVILSKNGYCSGVMIQVILFICKYEIITWILYLRLSVCSSGKVFEKLWGAGKVLWEWMEYWEMLCPAWRDFWGSLSSLFNKRFKWERVIAMVISMGRDSWHQHSWSYANPGWQSSTSISWWCRIATKTNHLSNMVDSETLEFSNQHWVSLA